MASRDELLDMAAGVVCDLSAGQAEALALEFESAASPRIIRQVAGLAAPRSVIDLSTSWLADPWIDGSTMAAAIRCAARAVKTVSSYEKLELLVTGPGASAMRRTHQGLLEVIRGSRIKLWVVSYVVGFGVDEALGAMSERASAGIDVRVLVDHRTDKGEASLTRLAKDAPMCAVLLWPDSKREFSPTKFANLHAKCAVADGRQAFVSSANLTGWAMATNLELGCLVTGGSSPAQLQSHLDGLEADGEIVPI